MFEQLFWIGSRPLDNLVINYGLQLACVSEIFTLNPVCSTILAITHKWR